MRQLDSQIENEHSVSPEWLDWETFCDLLGGASWSEICERSSTEGLSSHTQEHPSPFVSRFTERGQFRFADSTGAVAPLESLWLKWRLFATVSGWVLRIHSETHRPLLNLHPSNFRIHFPEHIDPLLPARWQFNVQIVESSPAVPFAPEGMPSSLDVKLFRPTAGIEGVFLPPEIRHWPLGQSSVSRVLIRSMEQVRNEASLSETVRGMVRLHILEDSFLASEFSDKDIFQVSLPIINGSMTSITVWGKKVESAERGLVIDGKTEPTDKMTWESLHALQHDVWNKAKILVYRSFHVPCDLYSLGMLLLRTVLSIRESEEQRLESLLSDFMLAMHKIVKSVGAENTELLDARFSSLLKEQGGLFSQRALLYPGIPSQAGVMMISEDFWDKVIQFAFRLMTRIPGFSFCDHAGDYSKDRPQSVMEAVMLEVVNMGDEMNKELFGSRQRNREILSACQQLREERARAH